MYWYDPSSSGSPSFVEALAEAGAVAPTEVARRDASPVALPPAVHGERARPSHGRADRGDRAGHGDVVAARRQQLVDLDLGLLRRRQELGIGGDVRHERADDVGVRRRRQGGGADAGRQRRRRHTGDRRRRRGGRWGARRGGRRRCRERGRRWLGRRRRHGHGGRQLGRRREADRRRYGHRGRRGQGRRRREALLVAGDGVARRRGRPIDQATIPAITTSTSTVTIT